VAQPITSEPLGAAHPAPLPDGTLLYAALRARGWELRRRRRSREVAGHVHEAAAVRSCAACAGLRDRLHDVAVAASAFSDPGFENDGPTKVRRRSDGGNRRRGVASLRRGPGSFPAPVPRRGRLRPVSSVLGNRRSTFRVGVVVDLGSHEAPNLTVGTRHYAALGASFVTRRWRRLATWAAWSSRHPLRHDPTPLAALSGVTRRISSGLGDAHPVRVCWVPFRFHRRTGSRGPRPTAAGRAGHARCRTRYAPGWRRTARRGSAASAHDVLALRRLEAPHRSARHALAWVGWRRGVTRFLRAVAEPTRAFRSAGMRRASCRGQRAARAESVPSRSHSWAGWPPPPRGRQGVAQLSPTG